MSEHAAQAFMERLRNDEAFQARVTAAGDRDQFLELVKAEGFDCSPEEIAAQVSRLEDAELGAVAAGGSESELPTWKNGPPSGAVSQEMINDPYGVLRYAIGFS
jgi:predicted ribosomally synthesized peptide with nif11-like leader